MVNYNLYFKISDTEIRAVRPDGLTGLEWFRNNSTPLIKINNNVINGNKYTYFNVIVDDTFIAELPNLLSYYPSSVVIGLWKENGLQYGWKYNITIDPKTLIETKIKVRDTSTNIKGNISNLPLYPFNKTNYLSMMSDVKTFDKKGVIISTTRPTKVKTFSSWSGWADKDFS